VPYLGSVSKSEHCVPVKLQDAAEATTILIQQLKNDVAEAWDNLLLTKITQTHYSAAK